MRARRFLVALTVLIAVNSPAAQAQGPSSGTAGLWTSEGYGFLFDVVGDTLRAYEVSAISCIPSFTAVSVSPPPGAQAAFRFTSAPVTVLLLSDQKPGRSRFHMNGAASDIIVNRTTTRPASCGKPLPNTPQSNFDVFAQVWSEQYPFFEMKRTDWAKVVEENRQKVTDATTPAQLFDILQGMIEPLQDAHTSISASDISKRFSGSRPGGTLITREQAPTAFGTITKYLTGNLHTFCEGNLEFGMLAPDIGYLRIRSFSRYHADGSFDSGLTALEAALDTIFAGAVGWKGFVTDVRINGGGADPYGLAIASRLATKDYVAYLKEARLDPKDASKWTSPQTSMVRVSNRPGFKGPVVHLTGVRSISAAETFTQALINREPKVTRVGENTQGVFSDVLGRRLPNGWRFGLPNERFVTNGKSYDGPGIPPDVEVPVFPASDLQSGRDGAVERALTILGSRPR